VTVHLSPADQAMLVGEQGPASKMDMSIIARMAEFHQAERLLDIEQAHIDSAIYMGEAGLEFAERLAGLGATVAVPTTLNVSAVDEHHWREWAEQAQRQMAAYARFARHLRGHHRASAGCGPAPDRKPGRAGAAALERGPRGAPRRRLSPENKKLLLGVHGNTKSSVPPMLDISLVFRCPSEVKVWG